jgi:diaminopimelate epimerase
MLRSPTQLSPRRDEPLEFFKMSGAGNDFVVFDNRSRSITEPEALTRAICTRRLSVGADGLILIEPSARATFRMRYFNSDGSSAFCANGTRCAARFAFINVIAQRKMTIETDGGIVGAEIHEQLVTLSLPSPRGFQPEKPLDTDLAHVEGSFIITGVPHYVAFIRGDLWSQEIEPLGRAIRFHPELAPEGANVNFVVVETPGSIAVRTYERGVEGETLACGSGIVSSVAVAALFGRVGSPVSVLTRSGIRLTVAFEVKGGEIAEVKLTGDARLVFRAQLTPETVEGFDPEWVRNPTIARGEP